MSKKNEILQEQFAVLSLRHERLVVKAKGRKRAIKDLNRFVKYMRRNDDLLTIENQHLSTIVDNLTAQNQHLTSELAKALSNVAYATP